MEEIKTLLPKMDTCYMASASEMPNEVGGESWTEGAF